MVEINFSILLTIVICAFVIALGFGHLTTKYIKLCNRLTLIEDELKSTLRQEESNLFQDPDDPYGWVEALRYALRVINQHKRKK